MPDQIGQANVHINHWMTNYAILYRQERDDYVALSVFPMVPSEHRSDNFLIFKKDAWFRDDMPVRGMGEEPAYDQYETENGIFACEERALGYKLDDRIPRNADDPLNPDMRATQILEQRALIKMDREWTASYFNKESWSTSWEGVTGTGSESGKTFQEFKKEKTEPILFFGNRADEMQEKTAFRPNVLVLGAKAYTGLRNNAELVERIKFISQQEPALVGRRAMAAAFEVDEVVVARAVYNNAQEGAATKMEFIANPHSALLAYRTDGPSLNEPSAGYTIAWTKLIPGVSDATAGVIFSGRLEHAFTDWWAIRSAYDMKVTASDLGMYFSNVA